MLQKVANGGDGSLRIFDGSSFQLLKSIAYGDDADNVRYDSAEKQVWVGYWLTGNWRRRQGWRENSGHQAGRAS
jgi:hypothetical protein